MRDFLDIAKALSDGNRVRALVALRDRRLCVCQIVELLGLAASTVSKHMSILRQAGLVESDKSGRWVYYRRPSHGVAPAVREALDWVDATLEKDPVLRDDSRRIRQILKIPVEELCKAN